MLDGRHDMGIRLPESTLAGRVRFKEVVEVLSEALLDARGVFGPHVLRQQQGGPMMGIHVSGVVVAGEVFVAVAMLVSFDQAPRWRQRVQDARHERRPQILPLPHQRRRIARGEVGTRLGEHPEREQDRRGMFAPDSPEHLSPARTRQTAAFVIGWVALRAEILPLRAVVLMVNGNSLDAGFMREACNHAHVVLDTGPCRIVCPSGAVHRRAVTGEEAFSKVGLRHERLQHGHLIGERLPFPGRVVCGGDLRKLSAGRVRGRYHNAHAVYRKRGELVGVCEDLGGLEVPELPSVGDVLLFGCNDRDACGRKPHQNDLLHCQFPRLVSSQRHHRM